MVTAGDGAWPRERKSLASPERLTASDGLDGWLRVGSRFNDPREAGRLLDAITAGGMQGAAAAFGVSRVSLNRWINAAKPELLARVELAKADYRRGSDSRVECHELVEGEVMPAGEQSATIEGEPVELVRLAVSPCSRAGRMTSEELLDHMEYAVRHPDHPMCKGAFERLWQMHFGVDHESAIAKARKKALESAGERERRKVLREPIPQPDPEGA